MLTKEEKLILKVIKKLGIKDTILLQYQDDQDFYVSNGAYLVKTRQELWEHIKLEQHMTCKYNQENIMTYYTTMEQTAEDAEKFSFYYLNNDKSYLIFAIDKVLATYNSHISILPEAKKYKIKIDNAANPLFIPEYKIIFAGCNLYGTSMHQELKQLGEIASLQQKEEE